MKHASVTVRLQSPPDDLLLMIRAGERGIEPANIRRDATRSRAVLGILGISVQASLPGETLADAWHHSRVLVGRPIIWWTTAGNLRRAGYPLLATGQDERHYTVVLADLEEALVLRLAALFVKEEQ